MAIHKYIEYGVDPEQYDSYLCPRVIKLLRNVSSFKYLIILSEENLLRVALLSSFTDKEWDLDSILSLFSLTIIHVLVDPATNPRHVESPRDTFRLVLFSVFPVLHLHETAPSLGTYW